MLITADNAKWRFEHHYPTPSSKYTNCICDQTLVTRLFQTPCGLFAEFDLGQQKNQKLWYQELKIEYLSKLIL